MPIDNISHVSLEHHVYPALEEAGLLPVWWGDNHIVAVGGVVSQPAWMISPRTCLHVTGDESLAKFLLDNVRPFGEELDITFIFDPKAPDEQEMRVRRMPYLKRIKVRLARWLLGSALDD